MPLSVSLAEPEDACRLVPSHVSLHQNLPEVSALTGLQWDPRMCISHKFPGMLLVPEPHFEKHRPAPQVPLLVPHLRAPPQLMLLTRLVCLTPTQPNTETPS